MGDEGMTEESIKNALLDGVNAQKKPEDAREEAKKELEVDSLKIASEVAARLEAKKKELEEVEQRLDNKVKDFKELVKNTEIAGKALAGQQSKEVTEDDIISRQADSLISGSGLRWR